MKIVLITLLYVIGFQTRGFADLVLTIPQDTFFIGGNISRGQQIVIPIYVDTISQNDSVCGYQIKFSVDSNKFKGEIR